MNKLTIAALLTGATCIGVGATVVLTAKCAEKAEAQGLTPFDKENWTDPECRREMGKTYLPSIISASTTMALAISSHIVSRKQVAAVLGTAATSAALLTEYRKATKNIVGQDNYNKIVNDVNKKKADIADDVKQKIKNINNTSKINSQNDNYITFYDEYTGKHYIATMMAQLQAENYCNMNLAVRNRATLEEYFGFIGESVPDMYRSEFWDHE